MAALESVRGFAMLIRWPALVLCLFVAMSHGAAAEPVRLVTGNGYPPFAGKDLPNGGLATEIVRSAYAVRGIATTLAYMPWKRGYRMTLQGEFDATFPYIETAERKTHFLYSDPIYVIRERPVVVAESDARFASFDDLRGKAYCLPHDFATAPKIKAMRDSGQLRQVEASELEVCMRALARGRVDFVPLALPIARRMATRVFGTPDAIRLNPLVIKRHELAMIFPRGADAETKVATFNQALGALRETGAYDRIVTRHLGPAPPRTAER